MALIDFTRFWDLLSHKYLIVSFCWIVRFCWYFYLDPFTAWLNLIFVDLILLSWLFSVINIYYLQDLVIKFSTQLRKSTTSVQLFLQLTVCNFQMNAVKVFYWLAVCDNFLKLRTCFFVNNVSFEFEISPF